MSDAQTTAIPLGTGGGTPGQGGSGASYPTLTAALAGETATEVTGVVPQAGTVAGTLVGPSTLSAVNDFYKGWYIVNTDTTPSSGLVARAVRVASYDGPTRTFTLDGPWDFSAESDVAVVDPARVGLIADTVEDLTINKSCVLTLGGLRLKGKIDITAAKFVLIRGGDGSITNGVQKTDFGFLRMETLSLGRRDTTIYALLLTSGNDLGRCEIEGIRLGGVIAARRGYMGWKIQNCSGYGLADGVSNVPSRLVESISGVSVVMTSLDADIVGPFAGSVVYSENSITGTAYVGVQGDVTLPSIPPADSLFTSNRPSISIWRAQGAGVINMTLTSVPISAISFSIGATFSTISTTQASAFSYVVARDLTGSISLTMTGTFCHTSMGPSENNGGATYGVEIIGSTTNTGNITLTGGGFRFSSTVQSFRMIGLRAAYSGTLTSSVTVVIRGYTPSVNPIAFSVNQTSGTTSISQSGQFIIEKCSGYNTVAFDTALTTSITGGAYTVSGAIIADTLNHGSLLQTLSSVTGGTFILSGTVDNSAEVRSVLATFVVADTSGTNHTVTVSSSRVFIAGWSLNALYVINCAGSGMTMSVSGIVTAVGFRVAADLRLCNIAVGGSSSGNFSGSIVLKNCRFEGASFFLNAVSGATALGPTSVTFDNCSFASTLSTHPGIGTVTWSSATMTWINCYMGGLLTMLGTAFSSIQFFNTRFDGNSSNNSVSFSGTRPTTYRYWKCSFAARMDAAGTPDIIDDCVVLPAAGSQTAANLVTVNSSGQTTNVVAGSNVILGVLLNSPGGSGQPALVLTKGKTMVAVTGTVNNGDHLVADTAGTPTSALTNTASVSGKNVGFALEAKGTTVANQSYAAVGVS